MFDRIAGRYRLMNTLMTLGRDRATVSGFSGHADKHELRRWVEHTTGPMRGFYLVHGDETPAAAFRETLRTIHPHANVVIPEFSDSVELR